MLILSASLRSVTEVPRFEKSPGVFLVSGSMSRMANQGVAPPDFTTPVGMIRLYLGDTDATALSPAVEGQGTYIWYSDAELTAFLSLTPDPRRVAVRILRMIAVSQVLMLKKWTSADLSVDGPAIADSLLAAAKALEGEVAAEDDSDSAEGFVVVPTGGVSLTARHLGSQSFTSEEADALYPRISVV